MQISGRTIGCEQPPFIVAEVSCNHGGQREHALSLIRLAHEAGADAVKFQAYEASTITIESARPEFKIREGLWAGHDLHTLYRETQTPFRWFPELAEYAAEVGIIWFASVFDRSSVDMLMKLGCPAFKIASFELIDLPLIRYVAQTRKPMILSTGMANDDEITDALVYAGNEAALLHCVSGYPTPEAEANLERLQELHSYFPLVGLSDHTVGIEAPIAATALGACIIEKHFKPQWFKGPDAKFSLAPAAFKAMTTAVRNAWAMMQPGKRTSEEPMRALRRSLWVVREVAAGERFTSENVRSIRPGGGLAPKELDAVLGKMAASDIPRGTPLAAELISPTDG